MELSVRDYKRAIADGKIDNWSPKDVEQWLHSVSYTHLNERFK